MVKYTRLWETMKDRGMTQYRLINYYSISAAQIARLKKNQHVSTHTLETLCSILQCSLDEVVEITAEAPPEPKKRRRKKKTVEKTS